MKRAVDRRVAAAQRDATLARERIGTIVAQLRHQANPRTVVLSQADHLLDGASALFDASIMQARTRPWIVALVATIIGIGIAARTRTDNPR